MTEHEVEGAGAEGQTAGVALDEPRVRDRLLGGETGARSTEARLEVEADREGGLLREGERGAAAAAAGVQHAPVRAHARSLEGLQHLRAAAVLEDGVVVLAAEAEGGRLAQGRLVDRPHDAAASSYRPR